MTSSFKGKHVIVTSGPTRERIDPVRYISNDSSGKQGHAIAEAFAAAGARVTLISGPVHIPYPDGVNVVQVQSACDMLEATLNALPADIAVFSAAVGDFRVENPADHKIKKREAGTPLTLTIVENPDILKTIGHHENRPEIVIGFAAETENLIRNAEGKLARKNADMILANNVYEGNVFGKDETHLIAVTSSGADDWGPCNKHQAAQKLVTAVAALLKPRVA